MRPFDYARAPDADERASPIGQRRPGRRVPRRRHDPARPDAKTACSRPSGWSTSPGCRCAASRVGDDALRVGALDDDGARSPPTPTVGERLPARPRGAAARRLAAAAQHGDDRRQPAAAHALPVLPRPGVAPATSGARAPAAPRSTACTACTPSSAPASTASRCTPPTSPSRSWPWTPSCTSQGAVRRARHPVDRALPSAAGRPPGPRDRARRTAS